VNTKSLGIFFLPLALVSFLCSCAHEVISPVDKSETVLEAFASHIPNTKKQLPHIVDAAETVADRIVDHPDLLIKAPYFTQRGFNEEIRMRSGGLARIVQIGRFQGPQPRTEHDVVLYSMRSWQMTDQKALRRRIDEIKSLKQDGSMIILFASKAGMPKNVEVDFLIDNGATSGSEESAPVNAIVNVLNVWLWNCEFAAAMTRRNQCPNILKSAIEPGGIEFDELIGQIASNHWTLHCRKKVSAGQLAKVYLTNITRLLAELRSDKTQAQVNRAADIISSHINNGGKVGISSCTHVLLGEIREKSRTPWVPISSIGQPRQSVQNLSGDDLLVWFSYVGMNLPGAEYDRYIRESGAGLIICSKKDERNLENNAPEALAHIDQTWEYGDAVVPIPCPPGIMAPISGINQALLYRMLDEATFDRLDPKP